MTFPARATPYLTPMRRGRLPACCCRHVRVDGLQRPSGRNAFPSGNTPSNILSPARSQPGSWTEVSLGVHAHTTLVPDRAHAPPINPPVQCNDPDPTLDTGPLHK